MKRAVAVMLVSITLVPLLLSSNTVSIPIIEKIIVKEDPYYKICVVFVGQPKKQDVKSLLEAVMKKQNLIVTDENIIKAASCVLSLRKTSKIGLSEMQILKHMYRNSTSQLNFANQAAISFTLLETKK